MKFISEVQMEQGMLALVSVMVVGCTTFLGFYGKVDASTIMTGVVSGLFGYAGASSRGSKNPEELLATKENTEATKENTEAL